MSESNIYKKIVEIRKSIDVFTKDEEGHKYRYVSGAQVLKKIKQKMDELSVVLIPEIPNALTKENNGNNFLISGEMKYVWVNADNPTDRIEVPWYLYGQQNDPSKAFGSGLTYSERYFLLKFFSVPTDEDDPDAQQGAPKGNNKPSYNNSSQQQRKLSEAQVKRFFAVAKDCNIKSSDITPTLKQYYGTNKVEELSKQQYDEAIERMQNKAKKEA